VGGEAIYSSALKDDLTTGTGQETGDQIEESGLTGSIRANESGDSARLHLKRTTIYRPKATEVLDDISYLEDWS
jgi:hypothetical protein